MAKEINKFNSSSLSPEFIARRLLENDSEFRENLFEFLSLSENEKEYIKSKTDEVINAAVEEGYDVKKIREDVALSIFNLAERISSDVTSFKKKDYIKKQLKIDRVITGRALGIPIMLFLLGVILYITIVGANYPSEFLSNLFFSAEEPFYLFLTGIGLPAVVCEAIVYGVYRVLAWVVSVMLPPMAIFFPLFTLLEDLGYLPRVAFNLDNLFRKCDACGKQALTMSMGFGCNAVGVTGCRIISSPRERLIAILTNNFVPCNGRFPRSYVGKLFCP